MISSFSPEQDIESSIIDHKATYIFVKTSVNYKRAYIRNVRLYNHTDFYKLNTFISGTAWHQLATEANDVNHITENCFSTFLKHVRDCIPEKTIAI